MPKITKMLKVDRITVWQIFYRFLIFFLKIGSFTIERRRKHSKNTTFSVLGHGETQVRNQLECAIRSQI